MKHVVITGSTRGIGFGLAKEFLQSGCKVTINGRTGESVNHSLLALKEYFRESVDGFPAAIEDRDSLEALWDFAARRFGKVDLWINNAGIDKPRKYFWEMKEREYEKVIHTADQT